MHLTALIPVYNDDYALGFCLDSIVPHFDEVIVYDDASSDSTPDVAYDCACAHGHVHYYRNRGAQVGWVEARNRLLGLTDSEHLFWLDSDDVLCGYNAGLLREIASGKAPAVLLQLCEMWGDLSHTTQRLKHYDRCHLYVNRGLLPDFAWHGSAMARTNHRAQAGSQSAGPLLFHIKGVKPDRRLLERQWIRGWLRNPGRRPHLGSNLGALSQGDIHRLAVRMLLTSKLDKLVPTYLHAHLMKAAPRRPEVIEAALPGRFRMIYRGDKPVDRVDTGQCPGII